MTIIIRKKSQNKGGGALDEWWRSNQRDRDATRHDATTLSTQAPMDRGEGPIYRLLTECPIDRIPTLLLSDPRSNGP